MSFSSIQDALEHFRDGGIVVVMDDEDRENEGDFIMAAEHAKESDIVTILRYTTGILCTPMLKQRALSLGLTPMVVHNTDAHQTAFTITTDHKDAGTGVSAKNRCLTINALADPNTLAGDMQKPGHIFPLVAREGGVLERRGHTEAALDLCRLSKCRPVGLVCELQHDDGTMMRLPACEDLAKKLKLPIINIEQLARYRTINNLGPFVSALSQSPESLVSKVAECEIPVKFNDIFYGNWTLKLYEAKNGSEYHSVLMKGSVSGQEDVLTRMHSECFTGHILGSIRCDCMPQFVRAVEIINKRGSGVVIYVGGHEGRGIGLLQKVKAYKLQSEGLDTYKANEALGFPKDLRDYTIPVAILKDLGIKSVDILTNNPKKVKALGSLYSKQTHILTDKHEHNTKYLESKFKEQGVPESILRHVHAKEAPLFTPHTEHVSKMRFTILRTAWNESVVGPLADRVKSSLLESKVDLANIDEVTVPGSFELPLAAKYVAERGNVDAIICLGVLIKGETKHFEYISKAVSNGIMQAQLQTGVPMLYGVLNCMSMDQATERCVENSDIAKALSVSAISMAGLKSNLTGNTQPVMVPQPCAK
mmetsp:Transcript_19094/g.21274  ORF Transcript_19094/g.21274 Transcript_19094/m.21274 type:complete len:591 (+) Transcript_19094:37-1809(+)